MDIAKLIPDGFKRALAGKAARWAGTMVGGTVAGYLLAHTQILGLLNQFCSSLSSEDAIKGFFGAGAVALVPLIYSFLDAKNVNGKIAVAASTAYDKGQAHALQQAMQQGADVQAAGDQTKVAAVAGAMAAADMASKPEKAAVVAALKDGTF